MFDEMSRMVGEEAITHRFLPMNVKANEMKELDTLRKMSPYGNVADMCYLKSHRLQLDRIAVDAVLRTIPIKKRLCIIKKFRDKASSYNIKCDLNLDKSDQWLYTNDILTQIGNVLLYRSNKSDYFSIKRIINIINLIDYRLILFHENESLREKVDPSWLSSLEAFRSKYSTILTKLTEINLQGKNDAFSIIMRCKINNPDLSNKEIAKMVYFSPAMVSINLKKWSKYCDSIFLGGSN